MIIGARPDESDHFPQKCCGVGAPAFRGVRDAVDRSPGVKIAFFRVFVHIPSGSVGVEKDDQFAVGGIIHGGEQVELQFLRIDGAVRHPEFVQ